MTEARTASGNGRAASAAGRPDPEIAIVGARAVERSAVPALEFEATLTDAYPGRVFLVALTVLITIEPGERSYDERSREALVELFGEAERWSASTGSLRWGQVAVLVPSYASQARFSIPLDCGYDHEVATTKYFSGIEDGGYPLRFHFNGTVYYEGEDGALQMLPLPWDRSARFELPARTWREAVAAHYPEGGWVHLSAETLRELARYRTRTGTPTTDRCVRELLADAEGEA